MTNTSVAQAEVKLNPPKRSKKLYDVKLSFTVNELNKNVSFKDSKGLYWLHWIIWHRYYLDLLISGRLRFLWPRDLMTELGTLARNKTKIKSNNFRDLSPFLKYRILKFSNRPLVKTCTWVTVSVAMDYGFS